MPTPNVPEAELRRFVGDLRRLIDWTGTDCRLGVAVSGGSDSTALLLLAGAALPGRIEAATVDHGLRPASAAEAAQVAALCATGGIPHAILHPDVPLGRDSGNIAARAREARYQLLGQWARQRQLSAILVAHQMDDVAETFLMRALRGSGLRGLSRMAGKRPIPFAGPDSPPLLRPLLGWRRAELAALVQGAGMTPVDDPTNSDPRFDRARLRALLAREPDLDPALLAQAAANLGSAEEALAWATEEAWRSRATLGASDVRIDVGELPRDLQRRLAIRAVETLVPGFDGEGIDTLLYRLGRGETATLAGIRARGGRYWKFDLAPPRRGEH